MTKEIKCRIKSSTYLSGLKPDELIRKQLKMENFYLVLLAVIGPAGICSCLLFTSLNSNQEKSVTQKLLMMQK